MNKVNVTALKNNFKNTEKIIEKSALKILNVLRKEGVYLEVYAVSPSKMQSLNKEYRGKNKAAKVLSFKEPKSFLYPEKIKRIGEIFLNFSVISSKKDLNICLIHAILHLFDYQHKIKSDRMKMEKKENEIFSKLIF